MNRTRTLVLGGLASLALAALTLPLLGQAPAGAPAYLVVRLPAGAVLEIEGKPTKQSGELRRFVSPSLRMANVKYEYTLKATWQENGQPQEVIRVVEVTPGQEAMIDLREAVAKADPLKVDPPKVDPLKTEDKPKTVDKPKTEDDKPALTVPFVPTPQEVVDKMLELAEVTKDDTVYDLGCGDGRIVVTAAKKFGAKGVGVDLDPERVKESNDNVKAADVGDLVTIKKGDILQTDVSPATVVTLYLVPKVNLQLKPILKKNLKPGTRIVSHNYDMGEDWKPLKTVEVTDSKDIAHTVYLWKIGEDAKEEKKDDKKDDAKDDKKKDDAKAKEEDDKKKEDKDKEPDVIFVPTPQEVVDKMLELAKVTKNDVVYDLGCGNGIIVVTAAKKYGCKATGFDVDPKRIEESNENVKKNKVEKLVSIKKQDIFTLDLSQANVITLYLLPELNVKLMPQLEKMKPGSRIVSHDFDMEGAKPDQVVKVTPKAEGSREHTIYLWTIPLKKEKKDE